MSSDKEKDKYIPKIKTPKEVIQNAISIIKAEASGEQLGLKTRYSGLNIALGKYFRFRQVYAIAGLSGHGKSTMLNSWIQDFLNPELNLGKCKYPYILAHHCFEMSPEDEELRKASAKLRVSYNHLLSSQFNKESGKYNSLSQQEIQDVEDVLTADVDKPLYYFDEPCELSQIGQNIVAAIDHYRVKLFHDKELLKGYLEHYARATDNRVVLTVDDINDPGDIPRPKVVLLIDHTLLLKQAKDEYDILQTMRNLSKTSIMLKKKGYMVFFVGQFNNNIEKTDRIRTPELHYPIKSDIYAQGEIYNACDGVFTIHQPELMNILYFGKNQYATTNLVQLQALKMRFGSVGTIWLKNALDRGIFVNYPKDELKSKGEVN